MTVQPMKHLPLAPVRGTVQQMQTAVAAGAANDVYPDESIQLLDQVSADSSGPGSEQLLGLVERILYAVEFSGPRV